MHSHFIYYLVMEQRTVYDMKNAQTQNYGEIAGHHTEQELKQMAKYADEKGDACACLRWNHIWCLNVCMCKSCKRTGCVASDVEAGKSELTEEEKTKNYFKLVLAKPADDFLDFVSKSCDFDNDKPLPPANIQPEPRDASSDPKSNSPAVSGTKESSEDRKQKRRSKYNQVAEQSAA